MWRASARCSLRAGSASFFESGRMAALMGAVVRMAERPGRAFESKILREVPGATQQLPSAALGLAAGGRLPVDPSDPERSLDPVFQLDIALPLEAATAGIGGRVHVRFDHGSEPIAARAFRGLRRLFLRRLGI